MTALMRQGLARSLGVRFLSDRAIQTRVVGDDYAVIVEELPCRIYPPGAAQSQMRAVSSSHRSTPTGTVSTAAGQDVVAKDRLLLGNRLFEVIAPITPDDQEWVRRSLIREINQPERELWLALKPTGFDGASTAEPTPELVRVLPVPFIEDKPIETIEEREGGGQVAARLRQLEVSEIARDYLTESNLSRLLYCLVVMSDVTPTAEGARDRQYPRYRFNGSPEYCNDNWSQFFPWRLSLVQEA
ncbi:MAG: hypothetical protein AB1631_17405 [Acidobacteriota bacterium]